MHSQLKYNPSTLTLQEQSCDHGWKQVNVFTMCSLLSEPPSNGGRCQCRHFLWRRSCCGWRSGPDCGSSWMTSRPAPLSGCRGTALASCELTLGPTWMVDLKEKAKKNSLLVNMDALIQNKFCEAAKVDILLVLSFPGSLLRFPAWFMAFTMKMYLVPDWSPCTV